MAVPLFLDSIPFRFQNLIPISKIIIIASTDNTYQKLNQSTKLRKM